MEAQKDDYTFSGPLQMWSSAKIAAQSYGPGWHLPTKDELNMLWKQSGIVKGLNKQYQQYYWSSTEKADWVAWRQSFEAGQQTYTNKAGEYRVRAVRAFDQASVKPQVVVTPAPTCTSPKILLNGNCVTPSIPSIPSTTPLLNKVTTTKTYSGLNNCIVTTSTNTSFPPTYTTSSTVQQVDNSKCGFK